MAVGIGGYQPQWERAGRVVEEISGGPWDPDGSTCYYQLYHAVVDGVVRSQLNGKPVTDMSIITGTRWADGERWALPQNLEINLNDVRKIWNREEYDTADLISMGLIRPAAASIRLETAIGNLRVLTRMLLARLQVMSVDRAAADMNFHERWGQLERECKLLRSVHGQSERRLGELDGEWHRVTIFARSLLGPKEPARSKGGRRPSYDWDAAMTHLAELFEHHGGLSADDPEWSSQADVERALAKFLVDRHGREPAASTVRAKVKEFLKSRGAGN